MKIRRLLAVMAAAILMAVLAAGVLAQDNEVPSPYAGQKNPFPWDDVSAQKAGKDIYQRSCLGCHGTGGAGVAGADFSSVALHEKMAQEPDYFLWRLSEGLITRGMPPYKSSLSEEKRWQVLTYLWSLGKAAAPVGLPAPTEAAGTTLQLVAPSQAGAGQPLTLNATLRDNQGKPVEGAVVKFYILEDFFASGPMEIGEATTNREGIAALDYSPRHIGDMAVQASSGTAEAKATVKLPETDRAFYETEVGIKVPALGESRFIGPERLKLGEEGSAPPAVFRLPSGTLFWLAPILLTAMTIWVVYFYVIFQVYRIPVIRSGAGVNTRRVPLIGLVIITLLGTILVLMLVTSPISTP
ncbi:MAG: c-type cytochrome [Chloroflexota bacterium]